MSETSYQAHWRRIENNRQMHDVLANAILNKTLDMERLRQAEIRNKFEEIQKVEHVRDMRVN